MRTLTRILIAGEAAADRQTVIGPRNDGLDRENPPVKQSVMQLGVNGCLARSYSTRMRIIRNIIARARADLSTQLRYLVEKIDIRHSRIDDAGHIRVA